MPARPDHPDGSAVLLPESSVLGVTCCRIRDRCQRVWEERRQPDLELRRLAVRRPRPHRRARL